jgi:hypothetical protein
MKAAGERRVPLPAAFCMARYRLLWRNLFLSIVLKTATSQKHALGDLLPGPEGSITLGSFSSRTQDRLFPQGKLEPLWGILANNGFPANPKKPNNDPPPGRIFA